MTWEWVVLILGVWWSIVGATVRIELAKRPTFLDKMMYGRKDPDGEA